MRQLPEGAAGVRGSGGSHESVSCCHARLQGACTSTATAVCSGVPPGHPLAWQHVLSMLVHVGGSGMCWWSLVIGRGGGSLLAGVKCARRTAAGEPDRQRLGRVQRVAHRAQAAAEGATNAALTPRPGGGLERAPAWSPCRCCWQGVRDGRRPDRLLEGCGGAGACQQGACGLQARMALL